MIIINSFYIDSVETINIGTYQQITIFYQIWLSIIEGFILQIKVHFDNITFVSLLQ